MKAIDLYIENLIIYTLQELLWGVLPACVS